MGTRDYVAEEMNKRYWDEVAPVHGRSYDTESLASGGHNLDPTQVAELGDVAGKKVLHLQCHIGTDTLSLVRLGAQLTGIDFSGESLKVARNLCEKTGLHARFIESPLLDLPGVLNDEFDLIYTSLGVLCWISDIDRWARIIHKYLKPGGTFYIMESHPFLRVFDDEVQGLTVRHPYFARGEPIDWPIDWPDYSDEDYVVASPTREFHWTVGEILSALISVGLRIEFMHEFDFLHWKGLESMTKGEDGFWRLPEPLNKLPLLFSVRASRARE